VDTVKRLCVKKLPPILVIQLKRFDYDFEREQAIKFNDYFEFPRELGELYAKYVLLNDKL
jgi:ubiquitin carboxyl-terminal hydrolase 9/24